jgi:hypothetical protein
MIGRDELDSWGGPPPGHRPDRRSTLRHPARDNQAVLGWWDGREFRQVDAGFRNISLGGGLIQVEELPRSKRIWVRLEWPVKTQWRRARVLRVQRDEFGQTEAGLSFPELCDEELLHALVFGQTCLLRRVDDADDMQSANEPPATDVIRLGRISRRGECG